MTEGQTGELPEEEAVHATRVLRLSEGDALMLMDGEGTFYEAEVMMATPKRCTYRITKTLPQKRAWQGHLHVAMAPTKMMERTEWFVEKAVEIGVDEITFLNCQLSERKVVKLPRVDKIVVSAMKQSRKAWKTRLHDMTEFRHFIEQPHPERKYIAHCYEEIPRSYLFDELRKPTEEDDAIVMIGPEGDFSIDEVKKAVEAGYVSVHLGKSRLRTETAGLSAVMMMQLAQE
jgi:16S rRNA (uracil1498-N3)-methyltransferase